MKTQEMNMLRGPLPALQCTPDYDIIKGNMGSSDIPTQKKWHKTR